MDGAKHKHLATSRMWFLLLIYAPLFLPAVVRAQEAVEEAPPVRLQFETELADLWQRYLETREGDKEARKQAFENIALLRLNAPGDIFESASYLFLEKGFEELALGREEEARQEFRYAIRLNVHLWPAYAGLAEIVRKTSYKQYLVLNFKGFTEAFKIENSYFMLDAIFWFIGNIYRVLSWTLLLFVFIVCLKHLRAFYRTTVSNFEHHGMRALFAQLLTFFLLLLPPIMGANPMLSALVYLIIFFPFFDPGERMAAFLVFLIPIILPFLSLSLANVNYARTDPLLRAHLAQFFTGDLDSRIEFLKENPGEGELADLSTFTIARLESARGELQEARNIFESIPRESKVWPYAWVNKGNIHFHSKEPERAKMCYTEALEKDPSLAEAHYNMYIVLTRQNIPDQAERERQQAEKLGIGLGPGTVIDAVPDTSERFFEAVWGGSNPHAQDWYRKPAYAGSFVLTIVALVLVIVHLRMRNPHLLARICEKCGRIFFQSDSPEGEWCSQCVNLYIKKDDLPSEAKKKKHEEVKQFNKRMRLTIAAGQILMPGTKKIIGGHGVSGLMILGVWVGLIVFCLSPMTHISYPFMGYIQGGVVISWLILAIAVVYWAIFGLRAIYKEE